MALRQIKIFFLGLLAATPAHAEHLLRITACIDERPWIPYTNPDPEHPGDMQNMINEAARELSLSVVIIPLPWKRCQEATRQGKIDAIVGAAFVPFNEQLAEFPKLDEDVDSRRSLGTARVMLVRRLGSKAAWDGKSFQNVRKEIAVAQGTQIMITTVNRAGQQADDGGRTDEQNLKKLLQSRVDLMAAYEEDLKILIDAKYQGRVEILRVPLVETHYYLAFSKSFFSANRELAQKIWNKIAKQKSLRKLSNSEAS